MTWTALTYAFGSKLTSTKMTQNQDNFTAVMNKDAGAPLLANNYIVRAMINTATNTIGTASATYSNITLSVGQWGFWPQINAGTVGANCVVIANNGQTTGYQSVAALSSGDGVNAVNAQFLYLPSSPPYSINGLEFGVFFFCLQNIATGKIEAYSIAQDPPWAYNGPTNITTDVYDSKTGKAFKRVNSYPLTLAAAVSAGTLDEWMRAPQDLIEITMAVKNADMALIPHPFMNNDLAGKRVILLDPQDNRMIDFAQARKQANELDIEIADTIVRGKWCIDKDTDGAAPPGVTLCTMLPGTML